LLLLLRKWAWTRRDEVSRLVLEMRRGLVLVLVQKRERNRLRRREEEVQKQEVLQDLRRYRRKDGKRERDWRKGKKFEV
jgi:hypothetical protein